jgi:hypothetical protein
LFGVASKNYSYLITRAVEWQLNHLKALEKKKKKRIDKHLKYHHCTFVLGIRTYLKYHQCTFAFLKRAKTMALILEMSVKLKSYRFFLFSELYLTSKIVEHNQTRIGRRLH